MDYNKLQRTLYDIEPSNTQEELRKLQESAKKSASLTNETKNYLEESLEVAAGSLGMDRDYSISDFAALAGVELTESQKNGDYAKGNVPMPKAKPGRTNHPLDDKLVGSYEYDDDDDVEEGLADEVKQGYKNPQNFKKAFGIGSNQGKSPEKQGSVSKKKSVTTRTNSNVSSKIEKYSAQLDVIFKNAKLTREFEQFLNAKAPRRESASTQNKDSIKESLLKALGEFDKKKKR